MAAKVSVLNLMLVLLVLMGGTSRAYDFYVGGRDGWVQKPSEDFNHWAERTRFQVNDKLVFKYNKAEDSVLVVSQPDYQACTTSNPIQRLDGGDSVFQFDRSGPFFFISGAPGRCQSGQKLIVVVLAVRGPNRGASPPPAATSSPLPSPPTAAPSPSVSSAPLPSPVAAPTPSSISAPTASPVAVPTPSSISAPTPSSIAAPTPSALSAPTPSSIAAPTPSPTSAATPSAIASPTPSPTAAPTPSAISAPTPSPTAAPTPAAFTAPTPSPSAAPSPSTFQPSPSPSPTLSLAPSPSESPSSPSPVPPPANEGPVAAPTEGPSSEAPSAKSQAPSASSYTGVSLWTVALALALGVGTLLPW